MMYKNSYPSKPFAQYLNKLYRFSFGSTFSPSNIAHYVFSEQLIDTQGNVKAIPKEIVAEITEMTKTDTAKEQKVETETHESIEPVTAPG